MKFINMWMLTAYSYTKNGRSPVFGTTVVGKTAVLVPLYCGRQGVEKVSFTK